MKKTNWNGTMFKKSVPEKIFWFIDKRLFRWDHLPNLARLKFVQKSYLLLILIPLADQFLSPILTLPIGSRIELNLGWIYLIPGEVKISFELGMPFSWSMIYFLVLFLGIGSVINEIYAPRIIGRGNGAKATRQVVMQNFREVANNLFLTKRANHFMYDFVAHYVENKENLISPPNEHFEMAIKAREKLIPLQDESSNTRVNRYSVYYLAEHMEIFENSYDDALETIVWFLNETRLVARWLCGTCFLISIILFTTLAFQGLERMIF